MMFICNLCNKHFKYHSKLEEHRQKIKKCNEPKKEYRCDLCNVNFLSPAQQAIHDRTKKHQILLEQYNLSKINQNNVLKTYYENIIEQLQSENSTLQTEILKLKKEIAGLQTENLNLQNNKDIHVNVEYIYIIHCVQHLYTNIYKVGRTNNIANRLRQYPKKSKILYTKPVKDSKKSEELILSTLKSDDNFTQMNDFGNEYFRCELEHLITTIDSLL